MNDARLREERNDALDRAEKAEAALARLRKEYAELRVRHREVDHKAALAMGRLGVPLDAPGFFCACGVWTTVDYDDRGICEMCGLHADELARLREKRLALVEAVAWVTDNADPPVAPCKDCDACGCSSCRGATPHPYGPRPSRWEGGVRREDDPLAVAPDNVWGYRQNQPKLVARDLARLADVPHAVTHAVLVARGVYKWLAVRRDLIRLKDKWKAQVRLAHYAVTACRRGARKVDGRPREWWRGYLAAKTEDRADVRALCHSERWRAPDNDDEAQAFLARGTP